jgi:hypothetical protein
MSAAAPSPLSAPEYESVLKSFQDPQFRQLFHSYAAELANPSSKQELDNYLTQLEQQQDQPGFNSQAKLLLKPQPIYCIKLSTAPYKIFINLCTNHLIEKIEEVRVKGRGAQFSIPYSITDHKIFKSATKSSFNSSQRDDSIAIDLVINDSSWEEYKAAKSIIELINQTGQNKEHPAH